MKKIVLPLIATVALALPGLPAALSAAQDALAAPFAAVKLPFYVYRGAHSPDNHYAASGWMGDNSDIRLDDHWKATPQDARAVIRIAYAAKAAQKNEWAGIYWQHPPNNWGSRQGGYNLNGARTLTFKARGDKGGEVLSEIKIGGIGGDFADSGSAAIGPITLTKEWKDYAIDLSGQELSSISGGFCWTITRSDNPDGAVFFLDDIKYE